MSNKPGLFGLNNSNRNFENPSSWGKNQFNSSFPASLVCYLKSKNKFCNYLNVNNKNINISEISTDDIFGINPLSNDVFFAFESQYTPFNQYVIGNLPRIDLVIQNSKTGNCLRGLEIKLTALPDNTTCSLKDNEYGTEIVIRPDSIVYLAASIVSNNYKIIKKIFSNNKINISDWSDPSLVFPEIKSIVNTLEIVSLLTAKNQMPFLMQPIWKTKGKSPILSNNCIDLFIWSDSAFINFITIVAKIESQNNSISRQTRTAVWLFKMFLETYQNGKFNHEDIIDQLSYNTKNDKAFASSGKITNPFMSCKNLTKPRILKSEIKKIILGGGQNLLSPERRFDAIIYNSPELFK